MMGFDIRCCKSNKMHYICSANNPTMSKEKITLEKRVESIETKLETLIQTMRGFVKVVDENFAEVKSKIDTLEAKVDKLDVSTDKNFKDVKWELKKIQDVTKYADEYLNIPPAKA